MNQTERLSKAYKVFMVYGLVSGRPNTEIEYLKVECYYQGITSNTSMSWFGLEKKRIGRHDMYGP